MSKHSVEHHVVTSHRPVHSRPQSLITQKLALAQAKFQQLEWADIILCSNSPWSTPLHMVPKPSGDGDRAGIIAALTKLPPTIVTRYLTFTISTHDWLEQKFFPKWTSFAIITKFRYWPKIPLPRPQLPPILASGNFFECPSDKKRSKNRSTTHGQHFSTLKFCFCLSK